MTTWRLPFKLPEWVRRLAAGLGAGLTMLGVLSLPQTIKDAVTNLPLLGLPVQWWALLAAGGLFGYVALATGRRPEPPHAKPLEAQTAARPDSPSSNSALRAAVKQWLLVSVEDAARQSYQLWARVQAATQANYPIQVALTELINTPWVEAHSRLREYAHHNKDSKYAVELLRAWAYWYHTRLRFVVMLHRQFNIDLQEGRALEHWRDAHALMRQKANEYFAGDEFDDVRAALRPALGEPERYVRLT